MNEQFESFKGIHPGSVVNYLLGKRDIDERQFAKSLAVNFKDFGALLKSKRRITIPLSLKIESALEPEQGSLMTLQVHFDIHMYRLKNQRPGLNIPKGLFWDSDMSKMHWEDRYQFVITRVYERGDQSERDEVDRYYGLEKVNEVLGDKPRLPSGNLVLMPHLSLELKLLKDRLRQLREQGIDSDKAKAEEQKIIEEIKKQSK